MEASSFHHPNHHPFLVDQSLFSPNPTTTAAAAATTNGFFDEFHQPYDHHIITNGSIEVSGQENQFSIGNNLLQSSSYSSMSILVHDHNFERRLPTTNSSFNYPQSNGMAKKTCKRWKKQKKSNDNDEENKKKKMRDSKEEGQIGYIHVRARRGQATDSHSLAERVRREKISEKMKALQAIVPGCDKITGKAHMLDVIINYVHSLQNEIQILSLKLASVNPKLNEFEADFDAFMLKPNQNMTTNQQQLLSFQEHQMPCMISQNNIEILWDLEEQRQELDDPFAMSNFNSFH